MRKQHSKTLDHWISFTKDKDWFYCAPLNLKNLNPILPQTWIKTNSSIKIHAQSISKSLTVGAIPSFQNSSACASIVIYFVYARSIVYTRVGITFISVWKQPTWEDLFFAFVSALVTESRCMHYVSEKKFCKWASTKGCLQKIVSVFLPSEHTTVKWRILKHTTPQALTGLKTIKSRLSLIVRVNVVLNRTVVVGSD